jgi:hypothetical protein
MGKTRKTHKENTNTKKNIRDKSLKDLVRQEMKDDGMSMDIEDVLFNEEDEDDDFDDSLFI